MAESEMYKELEVASMLAKKVKQFDAMLALSVLALTGAGCSAVRGGASTGVADSETTSRVSVSVAQAQNKTVQGTLTLNGAIHAENQLYIVAETQGKVLKVYARTGARVVKGDILVQIDDELKQAAFETAQASFDKSRADWSRAQDLYAQKVIPESDLQAVKLGYASAAAQLKNGKRDLDNAKVRTPLSGVVTQKLVIEGAMLRIGDPVAQVVDTQDLKMVVQVGERDIMKIKEGLAVQIDCDLYPGVFFAGKVSAISPKGDAALTFPVEIQLKSDPHRPLFDGMSARVRIALGEKRILALPRASLVGSYQKPQVFVVREGTAHLVDIIVGGEYGTDFELLKGLGSDDLAVTNGQNNLSEGQKVEIMGEGK